MDVCFKDHDIRCKSLCRGADGLVEAMTLRLVMDVCGLTIEDQGAAKRCYCLLMLEDARRLEHGGGFQQW